MHDAMPAHKIIALQALVIQYLVLKVFGQVSVYPCAHLVAERQILWRIVQIHAVSVRSFNSTTVQILHEELVTSGKLSVGVRAEKREASTSTPLLEIDQA